MFLEDEMEPRGRQNEAVGREHYALASRQFLGATVDLEQTYAWDWDELQRLNDEMVSTSDLIVPSSSIDEAVAALDADPARRIRSEEHTSELQSLMRISYAVYCLQNKTQARPHHRHN